uniref:Protein kinase domain-containing protein n=1 Tax=Pseudictyota dubia TaxID=2749911 RepID=A0A7R9YZF5_9STRA
MTKKTAAANAKKQADGEVVAAKKKAEELLARANAAEAETKKRRAEEKDRAKMLAKLKESRKLLLGRFDVSGSDGQPMRCTDNEILIRAIDVNSGAGVGKPVVLQLLSDPKRLESELQARSSEDEDDIENTKSSHIIQVLDVLCDSSQSVSLPSQSPFQINYLDGLAEELQTLLKTHGNSSQYDASGDQYSSDPYVTDEMVPYPCLLVLEHYDQTLGSHTDRFPRPNLRLARGVAADVVVGLMMLHTEGKVHRDLSPRRIVRCTGSEEDYYDSDEESISENAMGIWKVVGLGSCGQSGEMVQKPGDLSGDWGYLPPEAATVIVEQGSGEDQGVSTDQSWDLWALGCVLYRLVFGSDLWTISRGGQISDEDLAKLSNWSKLDIWKRAAIAFPRESRTDGERAAIDLVAKLLAPTPEERMNNFEFGIISVHQHEFVEGIALEPETLAAFRATQELVAVEEADRARYDAIAETLSLEESWELSRARNVLLLGAFEPIHVHAPTSFVVLKKPLSSSDGRSGESALKEGMRWASLFGVLGPLVRDALLNNDVGAVGRFWARVHGLYRGNYVYMYLVDDMTGKPVILPPDQSTIGHGVPYPIQIKTRSDVLPKLLPLMHLTMRSVALYHGATGIARLFGGGSNPSLSSDVRQSAQGTVDDLKQERGSAATGPFGSFIEDVSRAKENRERFLRDDTNVRCRSLMELVGLYERKGLVLPGKARGDNDFVGLQRLSDDEGLALWTLLDDADKFRAAIKKRAEERLKEEKNLWGDSKEERIDELEDALAKSEAELVVAAKVLEKMEGHSPAVLEDEDSKKRIRHLEEALSVAKEDQKRMSVLEEQRTASLELTLKQTMAELEESAQRVKALESKFGNSMQKIEALEEQLDDAVKSRSSARSEGEMSAPSLVESSLAQPSGMSTASEYSSGTASKGKSRSKLHFRRSKGS